MPRVEFWFDIASTYSFLSAMRIEARCAEAGVALAWRPFMLGAVLKERGWAGNPAAQFPVKGEYMWRDLARRALLRGHGFQRPSQFPRSPVLANRVAYVAAEQGWCGPFARAAFAANFIEDRDISEPAVVAELVDGCGQPAQAVLALAQSPDVKEALRAQTAQASALGIFGAPDFVVDGELFWGDDRLEDALAWCRREGRAQASS